MVMRKPAHDVYTSMTGDSPWFNLSTREVSILGFAHPRFETLTVPDVVVDVMSTVDTPLDFAGRELVLFDVFPLRYRGVKDGAWQNGTHGGVGMGSIMSNCEPDCQSASRSGPLVFPPYCLRNVTLAAGDSCTNGSLKFNQTGFGYGEAEYEVSMRSPLPASDNFVTSVPVHTIRVLSLLDLQVQPMRSYVYYEARDNRTITEQGHASVIGLPHPHRMQQATYQVVPVDPLAADALFARMPEISPNGTLSLALRPGRYGNVSLMVRMSTSDDEVYGLCRVPVFDALERHAAGGSNYSRTCVTSRAYAGIRPHDESAILQERPLADYITTNFSISVLSVNNAPYFQLNCSESNRHVACAPSCLQRTEQCLASVSLQENAPDTEPIARQTSPGHLRLVDCRDSDGCCRVEVWNENAWGTVCDNSWDDVDAGVVCEEMGCSSGTQVQNFGGGSGQIWLDDVACTGSEGSLLDCPASAWGASNCEHSEDAGVCCSGIDVSTGLCPTLADPRLAACAHPFVVNQFVDSGNLRPSELRYQDEFRQSLSFHVTKVRLLETCRALRRTNSPQTQGYV